MKNEDKSKAYGTTNISFAAWLDEIKDIPLEYHKKTKTGKLLFIFPNNFEYGKLYAEFIHSPFKKYDSKVRDLKKLLY